MSRDDKLIIRLIALIVLGLVMCTLGYTGLGGIMIAIGLIGLCGEPVEEAS